MTKIGNHPLIGKWRITGMELWDAEFIDMLEPGYFQFTPVAATSSSAPFRASWTAVAKGKSPLHLGRER